MKNTKQQSNAPSRWLICVAAPREVRAVLDALGMHDAGIPDPWGVVRSEHGVDVLCTGVGKANAAGAAARMLDPSLHTAVLSVGIAGSLPGSGLGLCDSVLATSSVFADEGIGADTGFIPMDQAGFGAFPDGRMGAMHDAGLIEQLRACCSHTGPVASVSWCSGSDGCAQGVVERTGAIAEAMEGAAVALAARRVSPTIRTGEVRVVSNTTGDRANQRWALDESLERLADVFGRVARTII